MIRRRQDLGLLSDMGEGAPEHRRRLLDLGREITIISCRIEELLPEGWVRDPHNMDYPPKRWP